MSSDDGRYVEKIAFCSVLCAGFVYAGYNVFYKVLKRPPPKAKSADNYLISDVSLKSLSNKAVQTEDILLPSNHIDNVKSVKDRIKDLNLVAESLRKKSMPASPEIRPKFFRNSPWSSPLGCAKYLSVSAENINIRSSSPEHKISKLNMTASQSTLNTKLQSGSSISELSDCITRGMLPQECRSFSVKTLNNLQRAPSRMTLFETKNIVILLHSENEDMLLKTLYTISNCAAFTTNQELLCDSDCPSKLKDLLKTDSEVVKVATTQAISNLAVIEKSNRYFQPHIPILLNHAIHGKELLKSVSLTALANLALDPASHKSIVVNVSSIMHMARHGTNIVQLQSLRLLVNLSCNRSVIPSLLISEVPSDILDLINKDSDREVLLRILTFLANVVTFASQYIDDASKPTLVSVLHKFLKNSEFYSDVQNLSFKNDDDDVSYQAERLQNALSAIS